MTVCIAFRINDIASGSFLFLNGIIGNPNYENYAKLIAFYKTHSGLGLIITTNHNGLFVAVADDKSSSVPFPHFKFPSSKSNCTILNKWHIISVTWSNRNSNCWSNGEKLVNFNTGNAMDTDHCIIGNHGIMHDKSHLTGCIGEIGFYRSLTEKNRNRTAKISADITILLFKAIW